jgi:hypothetical protein
MIRIYYIQSIHTSYYVLFIMKFLHIGVYIINIIYVLFIASNCRLKEGIVLKNDFLCFKRKQYYDVNFLDSNVFRLLNESIKIF